MNTIISDSNFILTLRLEDLGSCSGTCGFILKFEQDYLREIFSDVPTSDDTKYQKWLNQEYPRQSNLAN